VAAYFPERDARFCVDLAFVRTSFEFKYRHEQAIHAGALPEAMLALLLKKKMLGLARLREIILLECGG
jgi:hypothetical protein